MAKHPQTLVSVPGFSEGQVDEQIAPLIKALWQNRIRTTLSCQAAGPSESYVWVEFWSADHAQAFLVRTVGVYVEEEESMYQRAGQVWVADEQWEYSCSPRDRNLVLETDPEDGGMEERHLTGQSDWLFTVSIRFPRADLPAVERAFAVEHGG